MQAAYWLLTGALKNPSFAMRRCLSSVVCSEARSSSGIESSVSISSRIFRNIRSIEVSVVVVGPAIIGSSLATAADVKRIARYSGGSIMSAVASQASFRRDRKPTILRSVRFKPFRWPSGAFFTLKTAKCASSQSPALRRQAAPSSRLRSRPRPRALPYARSRSDGPGFSFATNHRGLTDLNPWRTPVCLISDILSVPTLSETPIVSDSVRTE